MALVTAAAGLLGLLFVALSIHIRSVARSVFFGYVVALAIGFLALVPQTLFAFGVELMVLILLAIVPFGAPARSGLRATGVGYDRRVTVIRFLLGFALFAVGVIGSIGVASGEVWALYVPAARDRQPAVGRVQHMGADLQDPVDQRVALVILEGPRGPVA